MDRKFVITPLVKVGNIGFNETRDIVRNRLGEYTEFRKTKFSKNTTDNFGSFHVYYSPENTVDAVEFFYGSIVLFKNKDLFNLNTEELVSLFGENNLEKEENSLVFSSYGVEIVIEENRASSILVHKEGY